MTRGRHRLIERSRRSAQRLARRSRARGRRLAVAPWIVVSVVVALVLGGSTFGYVQLVGARCDGPPVTATVLASPDQLDVMSELAQGWQQTAPAVEGRCVGVTVESKDPSEVAAALGLTWDQRRDGPRPDVWVPDSLAWMLVAANRPEAAAMLPARSQSIASSPVVIAVPRPMADALGWPDRRLGWRDLVSFAAGGKTWGTFGHPEWGPLRLGMTDPVRSTSGLATLITVTDVDNDNEASARELADSRAFADAVTAYRPDATSILDGRSAADRRSAAPEKLSVFPAVEHEVYRYDALDPEVDVVPVYPRDGTAYADYPYAVLDAPWVDTTRRQIAGAFLRHLRSDAGRQAYGAAGFRDADRTFEEGSPLAVSGFPSRVPTAPRSLADPASILRIVAQWSTLRRPATLLTVVDTSPSGGRSAPGADVARVEVVAQAATTAVGALGDSTRLGLWHVSAGDRGGVERRQLVPVGPLGGAVGGVPHRQAVVAAVDGLRAGDQAAGQTGSFYDAVYAAFREAQRTWQPSQPNRVVLISDGGPKRSADGLTRAALVERLRREQRPDRPVEILVVTDATDADVAGLQEISRVTGGRTFAARQPEHLENVLFAALFAP